MMKRWRKPQKVSVEYGVLDTGNCKTDELVEDMS